MSDIAVKIRSLGKKYRIHTNKKSHGEYSALRDVVTQKARKALNPAAWAANFDKTEDFWALKDVDLDIRKGDKIGIIGRNGAGKSTILKILSRITEPTTGSVEITGRVSSLLEVGTGFHPELSGRENVYLNGSILGMKNTEIRKHFDEIVEFSGIEQFIDTPVKRYSSGMRTRLGFSIAAFLHSDILILDEVLAVGDMDFQKKCLTQMEKISKSEGRTILFVSHNLAAVQQLCNRGILLDHGHLKKVGSVEDILTTYKHDGVDALQYKCRNGIDFKEIRNGDDFVKSFPYSPAEITVRFENTTGKEIHNAGFNFLIRNHRNDIVMMMQSHEISEPMTIPTGEFDLNLALKDALPLCPGSYTLSAHFYSSSNKDITHVVIMDFFVTIEAFDKHKFKNFDIAVEPSLLPAFGFKLLDKVATQK